VSTDTVRPASPLPLPLLPPTAVDARRSASSAAATCGASAGGAARGPIPASAPHSAGARSAPAAAAGRGARIVGGMAGGTGAASRVRSEPAQARATTRGHVTQWESRVQAPVTKSAPRECRGDKLWPAKTAAVLAMRINVSVNPATAGTPAARLSAPAAQSTVFVARPRSNWLVCTPRRASLAAGLLCCPARRAATRGATPGRFPTLPRAGRRGDCRSCGAAVHCFPTCCQRACWLRCRVHVALFRHGRAIRAAFPGRAASRGTAVARRPAARAASAASGAVYAAAAGGARRAPVDRAAGAAAAVLAPLVEARAARRGDATPRRWHTAHATSAATPHPARQSCGLSFAPLRSITRSPRRPCLPCPLRLAPAPRRRRLPTRRSVCSLAPVPGRTHRCVFWQQAPVGGRAASWHGSVAHGDALSARSSSTGS
jgi:hypothetical protein